MLLLYLLRDVMSCMFAVHEYTRNTHMIGDSNMHLTAGSAQIQCITELALKFVNDAGSQLHGNFIFKPKRI